MDYKIEKVELPKEWGSFPFEKMKKGDSFLETDFERVNTMKVRAHYFSKSKKGKVKFSIRKEDGGYRCYRIK